MRPFEFTLWAVIVVASLASEVIGFAPIYQGTIPWLPKYNTIYSIMLARKKRRDQAKKNPGSLPGSQPFLGVYQTSLRLRTAIFEGIKPHFAIAPGHVSNLGF